MVSAVHGVMITSDVPIKQYILHLNEIAPAEGKFVIADLDDSRVLVQPEHAARVAEDVARYQQTTQFLAPSVNAGVAKIK